MTDLAGIPSDVLTAELKRRAEEAEKNRHIAASERARVIGEALEQPGVVDALVPEHDRTSCSDAGMQNGNSYPTGGRLPRCRRCALLLARREGWPNHLTLNVDIWFAE